MSAVARPGPQPITDVPLTVAEAVGLAGDVTPNGDLAHVMLTGDGKTHDINLLALYDKGDTAQNVLIKKVMSSMCRIAARRTEASLHYLTPASAKLRSASVASGEAGARTKPTSGKTPHLRGRLGPHGGLNSLEVEKAILYCYEQTGYDAHRGHNRCRGGWTVFPRIPHRYS